MNDRLSAPFVLVVGLFALACSRSEVPADPVAAPAPEAPPVATAAGPCQLNLYIWSEYIDPEVVADFERLMSCKVAIEVFDSNESMIAALEAGGTSRFDIVVPSDYSLQTMIRRGLLAPLRHGNIPNLVNLDDKFVNPAFDPGNQHSVAYQWGTVGIFLRQAGGAPPPRSWRLLFDPAQQPGRFALLDSERDMIGSVLMYLGHSVNTTEPAELGAAREALREAKKRSAGFQADVGGKNMLLARQVTAAVVFNGDAVRGMNEDPATLFFVPEEGGVIWVDNLAIPAQAPHRDTAEKFINFILDPQVGARLSNFNQYATPNRAAKPFITPADLANEAIYPSARIMARLEWIRDLGDENALYDELWRQVQAD